MMVRRSIPHPPSPRWLLGGLLIAALCLTAPGCTGCLPDPAAAKKRQEEEEKKKAEEEKKKKNEKPKEDYTFDFLKLQPSQSTKERVEGNFGKRGHWITAVQPIKANNFDVKGNLLASTSHPSGEPFDLEETGYSLTYRRPAALPKGQMRPLESIFYLPRDGKVSQPIALRSELVPTQGGYTSAASGSPITLLREWEFLFVVLSQNSSNFASLQQTQTFMPLVDVVSGEPAIQYYQLIRPTLEKNIPLPDNALMWTSIAYLLWDDVSLEATPLTPPQQEALVDWLHWGGQIVVNGPHAWENLKESFLAPYLPVESAEAVKLTRDDFQELDEYWSIESVKKTGKPAKLGMLPNQEFLGLEVEPRPDARFMPHTGNLVVERSVGRGRIVFTTFPLGTPTFVNWAGFDGFLNGCLLRRPARKFVQTQDAKWADWDDAHLMKFRRDARPLSTLRYFARDIGYPTDYPAADRPPMPMRAAIAKDMNSDEQQLYSRWQGLETSAGLDQPPQGTDYHFDGHHALSGPGVASWNDVSAAVHAGRNQLKDAAGIEIPNVQFVLTVLAGYLVVLVPLNWALFRLIGRVEWAWAAAPLIAIVGTVAVVRLAQLDIGFVRSRTEFDIVELHGGYSRGHVTRLTALYTSLSSGYEITFENPTTLAMPSAVRKKGGNFQEDSPLAGTRQLTLTRDHVYRLNGFRVSSNKAEELHIEQMHDFGGALTTEEDDVGGLRIRNGSQLHLREVGVLRALSDGVLEAAYLAELQPNTSVTLRFKQALKEAPWIDEWRDSRVLFAGEEDDRTKGELRAWRFPQLAAQTLQWRPGDVRLIAWTDAEVPGVTYAPSEDQKTSLSFVLAHLRRGPLPKPKRDSNVIGDVATPDTSVTITPEDAEAKKDEPPQ